MNYIYTKPGDMIADDGKVIGTHDGLMYYTIGQRKGLQIGGLKDYPNQPWFVIGKDLENNRLLVGQGIDHPTLYANSALIEDVNWIPTNRFTGTFTCTAKFRYRQADTKVSLTWVDKTHLKVTMSTPVRAVTPGQQAVFYDGDICLGGGVIDQAFFDGKKRMY